MTALSTQHSAQYAVSVQDGYDLDCKNDVGAPAIAFAAMVPGTIEVEFLNGDTCILPSAPPGYPWNIQVKKILGSSADTTAENIVALFNVSVDPKPEAWLELPADGYAFTEERTTRFQAKLIRPDLVEEAYLYNETDGYWAEMTIDTENEQVYTLFSPTETYAKTEWYVLLVDSKGRSIKSKNSFEISATIE